jgi:SAM-dependent methyltransferase
MKDYPAEVQLLLDWIERNKRSAGNRLLDVACGTGRHLEYLREHYQVEGLDLSEEMLAVARQRNPGVVFHWADMIDFDLGQQFDVVTCLFSSIGYVKTLENLNRAVDCMARHVLPGGVLVIEPWFTPQAWKPGRVHSVFIDEPELKIARINISSVVGRLSYFDFHYLIGTLQGVEYFIEKHEAGLFTIEEMQQAIQSAGLEVSYNEQGLSGRGLYIGRDAYNS